MGAASTAPVHLALGLRLNLFSVLDHQIAIVAFVQQIVAIVNEILGVLLDQLIDHESNSTCYSNSSNADGNDLAVIGLFLKEMHGKPSFIIRSK